MEKIRGKVIILGDDVDTDQILPGYAMSEPYEEIGKYAMAGSRRRTSSSTASPAAFS